MYRGSAKYHKIRITGKSAEGSINHAITIKKNIVEQFPTNTYFTQTVSGTAIILESGNPTNKKTTGAELEWI